MRENNHSLSRGIFEKVIDMTEVAFSKFGDFFRGNDDNSNKNRISANQNQNNLNNQRIP